jgi:Ca2+-binding RTX toxin-like protein
MPTWRFSPKANLNGNFDIVASVIDLDYVTFKPGSIRYYNLDGGLGSSCILEGRNIHWKVIGGLLRATSGTITEFTYKFSGDLYLHATGLSVSAKTLHNLILNPAVTKEQFQAFLLKGNDNIFGTNFASGAEVLKGWGGNDTIHGNIGNDTILGDNGNDVLIGGAGNDNLTGGRGADKFVFNLAPGGANVDVVNGFKTGIDKVVLDNDAFAGIGAAGALNPGLLVIDGSLSSGTQRFSYDTGAGALYYDADGNGAGAQQTVAYFGAGTALSADDFSVIN